jgi:CheY-like chemotaxis protein
MQDIKVAIVEDDHYMSAWLCSQLSSFGYQIPFTTQSGLQAIETILQSEVHAIPDLILMDINFENNRPL